MTYQKARLYAGQKDDARPIQEPVRFQRAIPQLPVDKTLACTHSARKQRGCVIVSTQHFRTLFDNRSLASTHLSRCSRHILSFDTFSFFETSFLRCSTVCLPFRLMVKFPPVVVCIFSVMSVLWGEPHPSYTSVPVARSIFST